MDDNPSMILKIKEGKENADAVRSDVALAGDRMTLGRSAENIVVLNDREVSRTHAELLWHNGAWHVRDLGSRNGTFVNGIKIAPLMLHPLGHGSLMQIGAQHLVLLDAAKGAVLLDSAEMAPLPLSPQPAPAVTNPPPATSSVQPADEIRPDAARPQPSPPSWMPTLRWLLPAVVLGLIMTVGAIAWRAQLANSDVVEDTTVDSHIADAAGFVPTPMTIPTVVPDAVVIDANSVNLLPNYSFEVVEISANGWELPVGWAVDSAGDDVGTPEVRRVSRVFLPVERRDLLVLDGDVALSIVTRNAPMRVRFFTSVQLAAGTYQFTANLFPDIKLGDSAEMATDPTAADVRLLGPQPSEWMSVAYGVQNNLGHQFTLSEPTTVLVGVDLRARFDGTNSYFLDKFALVEVE